MYKNLPTVAIVGRPNVGKSTLFNRLIQKRISITSDEDGVTRDRLYHTCEWMGRSFNLIDTGGFSNRDVPFQEQINKQVDIAIDSADTIVFVVSATEKPTKEDTLISKKLKKVLNEKNVIVAVNKSDNKEISIAASNYYSLGLGDPIPVSSIHGIGISDLLDQIIKLSGKEKTIVSDHRFRIGIIGKPNVGKSTLINTILKDDRLIVSDVAGTTRDSIDTVIKVDSEEFILTDTAGIKKNKKALDDVEWYSELRSHTTIENSDLTVLMIDPTQNVNIIDEKIMGILKDNYKPTIVLINKIDLIDSEEKKEVEESIREKFKFAQWVPIMFISAKDNKGINKVFEKIKTIRNSLNQEINKSQLNEFLMDIQMIKKPPRYNGIGIKLTYITYSNSDKPHFIIFSNHPDKIHFSYKRFIENQIRNVFNFDGVPIKISYKGKKNEI